MGFTPTKYQLVNTGTGRLFEDTGWTLADPESSEPALVRAVYENKQFIPREDIKGLYRYSNWLPIRRLIKHSHAPVTYKSKGLAQFLGLENLYITFSGYFPKIGAKMETCSFKETEAYAVCARLPKNDKHILVVQSAGNTARAFAKVCSDNNIPLVICIPEDNINDLWFRKRLKPFIKVVATPHGTDYFDAITLGNILCKDPRYLAEGGAKNIARRDGMGTTVLSAVEAIGRIPDAYFQAVGSGTGAIAAWENSKRLLADGRFGNNKMKIFAVQNTPFTIMYDSWKAGSRELVPLSADQSRRNSEIILAKVLSNRKPSYSMAGGLYDVLKESGGDMFKVTNDEIVYWMLQFFNVEGCDIFPAAASAVASLKKALDGGQITNDEVIMLNISGGGMLNATKKGFELKKPDLVLSPDLPLEEIISKVNKLFD
ncbi:MAG: cysteate synthase [Bacteroidales bacterium]|jgi:cysteate synthase|nr:cysteate synthase [Bacteroidales bacterium]